MSLRESVKTGIDYGVLFPGLVPPYEEREAGVFSGYTPTAWRELDAGERAMCVAHFRLHGLIALHQSDAVHNEITRRSRNKQG